MNQEAIDAILAVLDEQNQPGLRDFVQKAVDGNRIHSTAGQQKDGGLAVTGYSVPWIHLNTSVSETALATTADGITELTSVIAPVKGEPDQGEDKPFKSTAPLGAPVQLSSEEIAALPGASEFLAALMSAIVLKSITAQAPPT